MEQYPPPRLGCNTIQALPLCVYGISYCMVEKIQAFIVVIEEGSVNRAATKLRVAQPALSRQMQSLENELGGRLLERRTSGVVPTGLGLLLAKSMRPILSSYSASLAEMRREARGLRVELRIGYLQTAIQSLLSPAIARLHETHPDIKLKLHDLSPREQIEGLRSGNLDIALIGQEGEVGAGDFRSLKLCSLGVCAAFSRGDKLARRQSITLAELKNYRFIGVDEQEVPGRNRWMAALCRTGGFKPKFEAVVDGITNVLSMVVSEMGVTLLPSFLSDFQYPGISFVPVKDANATWDFILLWQRGKTQKTTLALIDALTVEATKMNDRH
jgi:DNA-binding transcriptional LysR family regulator